VAAEGARLPKRRVEGIDLARSLAFLGMVFVNFRTTIASASEAGSQGWLTWLDARLDGRAAATFVTLAGVGVSLMSSRARTTGDPKELGRVQGVLVRRAAFLFTVGLLYWSIWPADILHVYGVFLAVGALLLTAPDRWLLRFAAALVVGFAILLLFGPDYSEGWDWVKLSYRGFWAPRGFVLNLLYNGFHPVIPWLAFFLLGIWLGRHDLGRSETRRKLLIGGFLSAVVAETTGRLLVRLATPHLGAEDALAVFGTSPMPPMPLYMIAASGTAVTVIILSVLAAERYAGAPWLVPMVATGQMALTLYVGHVVVGLVPLEAFSLLEGRGSVGFSEIWGAVFCVGAVIFAHLWRRHYPRGPLEMLMRRITGE
jgi:uncharacterized membrane protein YeiB